MTRHWFEVAKQKKKKVYMTLLMTIKELCISQDHHHEKSILNFMLGFCFKVHNIPVKVNGIIKNYFVLDLKRNRCSTLGK